MPNEKNGVCRGSFEKDYWKLDISEEVIKNT